MTGKPRPKNRFGLSAKFLLVTLILSILPLLLIWFEISIHLSKMQVYLVKDAHNFADTLERMPDSFEDRAAVYAESTEREFEYFASKLLMTMLALVVAVSLLVMIFARIFAKKLLEPLEKLEQNIRGWDGTSPIDVFVEGDDEVADLARQFSLMTEKVSRFRKEAVERQAALEKADLELMQFNLSLEDRIEKRTQSLQGALEKLETLDHAKDEFLFLITHELKTPLTSISACAEALSGHVQLPEETRRKFLRIIQNESDRLTRLINEVLDYSRISTGKLPIHRRRINLVSLLERSILQHLPAFEKKGVRLKLRSPEPVDLRLTDVLADADRIHQVMTNLLNNALKFTSESGKVTVRLELLAKAKSGRDSAFAQVCVSDNGMGIEPKDRGRVFERFAQAGKIEHHHEGSGLGMPIARGIVQGHGGKMWFTSKPGKGTDFYFTLPLEIEGPGAVDEEDHDSDVVNEIH